jgi:hypothetical protein
VPASEAGVQIEAAPLQATPQAPQLDVAARLVAHPVPWSAQSAYPGAQP